MDRYGLATFFTALLALPLPVLAQPAHGQSPHASVCQLARFGAGHDGRMYETSALYFTDLRHGAWLVDPVNKNCWVQLGVEQSDIDGSVAGFMQELVKDVMRYGPGTSRTLRTELIFHWVPGEPHGAPASPRRAVAPEGEVELRRVFSSAPTALAPNQSSKRTRVPRAA